IRCLAAARRIDQRARFRRVAAARLARLYRVCARRARTVRRVLRAHDARRAHLSGRFPSGQIPDCRADGAANRGRAARRHFAARRSARNGAARVGTASRTRDAAPFGAIRPQTFRLPAALPAVQRARNARSAQRVKVMKLNDTTLIAVLCTLLTGLLHAASRDIAPFGPLVLIAPIPILLYALSASRTWRAFASAFVARVIGSAAFIYAYADALAPAILTLATVAAAAEFALVVALTRLAVERLPSWAGTLSFPVFATAAEFLIQLGSPHGTFGALGYALVDILPLVQIASVGGIAAVSFVAALVPMTIVMLIRAPAHWRSVLIASASPLLAASLSGVWRLSVPSEDQARVALASIDALTFQSVEDPMRANHVAAAYADLVQAFQGQELEAVVLPERVFVDTTGPGANASALLQDAANRIDARIVAGFDEVLDDGQHVNTARVFAPRASRLTYVKRRLIPGLESGLVPGREPLLIGDRAVAICKDLDFAPMIR